MTKKEYQAVYDGICKIVPLFKLTRMPKPTGFHMSEQARSIKLGDHFIADSSGGGNCWWKVDGDFFVEYDTIRYNLGVSYFTFVGYRQLVKAGGGGRRLVVRDIKMQ